MYPSASRHHLAKRLPSILQDRLNSYDSALEPNILGINSVENGIALGLGAFPRVREVDINSEIF